VPAMVVGGKLKSNTLTAFASSYDEEAKAEVLEFGRAIGFDAIDAGPLKNARLLENLGFMNITLGYMPKMGVDTGFKYLH